MAVAIEELTPEAQAIAARLHPAVKQYLEQKAGAKAAADADRAARKKSASSGSQDGQRSSSRSQGSADGDGLASAARFERQLNSLTPGRGSTTGGRIITALFVGVIALEVLSYMLGQPFTYSLKGTAAALTGTGKTPYTPLYSGQKSPVQPVSSLAGHGL